jgi:glycosyltransferase 2 family protein
MKKNILTILQYLFFTGLAVFFMWLSLRTVEGKDWAELKNALIEARYWLLIPIALLLLLSIWLRTLRWCQLIAPLGYSPATLNTFFVSLIGYFVNQGAPRLGEIVKCTLLHRYEKIPADKLVGTIVAERVLDVLCLLAAFGCSFIFQYPTIHSLIRSGFFNLENANDTTTTHSTKQYIFWGLALIVLLFFLYIIIKKGASVLFQEIKSIFLGVWVGLSSSRNVQNKPLFFLYTALIWLLYWGCTYLGFMVLAETQHLSPLDALTVLAIGSVGMIVAPGGAGAYPMFVQKTVLLYGIAEKPYGIAFGWLMWMGQFFTYVILGIISFVLLPYFNKNKHEKR